MKLTYNINDRPKFGQLIVFAIQQLLAIMAATLVVPVIVGHDMSPAAALFGAGVGTIVYLLFTKGRSPVFLGSSFAFIKPMAAAFAGGISMGLGYLGLILGAVFAGIVYVIIALVVKFVGVKWINRLMPAVVIGPTVAIIGLSLAGNAIGDLGNVNHTTCYDANDYQIIEVVKKDSIEGNDVVVGTEYLVADKDVDPAAREIPEDKLHPEITVTVDDDGNYTLSSVQGSVYVALVCGLITLFATVLCSTYGKKFIKLIPFIVGICSGYAAACVFYLLGLALKNPALMIVDFSPFTALLKDGAVSLSTFFALPDFTFLTAFKSVREVSASYLLTLAVAYVPVAFVVFAEHIADHKNISTIIEKDLLVDPGLHRTLLGDGVGSMAGALFGGCPNTTYGESIGCVAITGNASVVTILAAAVGAMIIAFLSPFVAFVNSISSCVMGGVCIALYGFIAVSGLKMVQKVDLEENRNLFVVSAILIAGIGGLTVSFGKVELTEVACALILGIIVNLMLSRKKAK